MKPGDKFAVNLNEHVVAEAVVIDIEDGKVTLDIPATRIVMGVKSSLTDLPDTQPTTERVLLGAETADGTPVSEPQAPKTTDESSTPQSVPAPVAEVKAPTGVPADAIGDGLANVPLKEMD